MVVFNFFISLVLLLCMDLICSQVSILTSECCYGTHCNWPGSIVQISEDEKINWLSGHWPVYIEKER